MKTPNIYVAGPVLRPKGRRWRSHIGAHQEREQYFESLHRLYARMEQDAKRASVDVRIPYFDDELDGLEPRDFAKAIDERVKEADAMIVVVVPQVSDNHVQEYSIACEAQKGAEAGKRLAIVAEDPLRVPRLLRALSSNQTIVSIDDVDFGALFTDLVPRAAEW